MEASSSVVQDAWLWSGSRKVFLTEEGNVADVNMQDGMYDMGVEADKVSVQIEGTASGFPDQLINLEGVSVDDVLQMQGFREKKWLEKMDRKREHKVVTRCGCLAEMRIKKKDGIGNWYVSRFIDEHNHEMVSAKFVNYLRSHRKISEVEIAHLTSMRGIGISIPKIYESFAAQLGGFNKVPFTKQDMYNMVRRQRELQGGDVTTAIRFLEGVARIDGRMFWRYKVGAEEHLHDLFWSDGRSQDDYAVFGDVLAFDATYGRNKYNLPVVVFSGVNHHNQTCVFATEMVSCESQESYIWVLQQFLDCMQGKPPISVITDGDPAMRIAIQSVFPQAHHRLCAWHLLRNATQNICDPRFTQLLRHCMLADMEIKEFEMHWQSMVDECGVVDVEWVKDLYRKKNSWATAYIRGRFFAGIRTTSRCESLHAKLGRFVESRYGVLEFVTNFQRCVDFLRDNEDELEFRSCYGTPVLQTEFVELEKSGWSKFTREMFWRFRESLKRCVQVRIFESKVTDQSHIYKIEKYRRPDMRWIVVWEPVTNNFMCTCMRMESFGLPCVHILAVCVRLDLCALPDSLVLRRWAKTAKLTIGSGEETTDHAATYRSRLGAFSQICKRLGRVACMSDEDFK
ncbi:protein FAR1-RELATED SEQUENCE 5-like [Arachis stenosperma]|uniref:protein FAR1-RELATED SEQUENCE 5-like n=1 Tax=Arachis stenosperma TaxID=217475 RepID=UPI0025AB8BB3|nr:protein FAR1-RELATED SEQUENCE 5-like [Arachis stenosperma]